MKPVIKKYNSIKKIILPNKKVNIFILSMLLLGVIAGAIYANIIGLNDRNLVIDKIKVFIDNINHNSLDTLMVFKNSIGINLGYIIVIWILGMSLIGIVLNILLLFMKGFVFGFSMAAFIITYGIKGMALSFLYLIFGQILNIISILLLSIYSLLFSSKLIQVIISRQGNEKISSFLKNYFLILILCIVIALISSVCETFLLPSLIKLVIKLYV